MAFNPFVWFRKHAKIGFAVLTIVCMLTFVLSSGVAGGDFFDQVARYFGGGRNRGQDVTELYGDTVTERDVRELTEARHNANDLLLGYIADAQKETTRDFNTKLKQLRDDRAKFLPTSLENQLLSELELYYALRWARWHIPGATAVLGQYAARDALVASLPSLPSGNSMQDQQMFLFEVGSAQELFSARLQVLTVYRNRNRAEVLADIDREQVRLVQLRKRLAEADKNLDAQTIDGLLAQLALDAWLFQADRASGEFVLGGAPTTDGVLDFMVWKKQADKLGITFTKDDCRKEFNRMAGKEVLNGDEANDKKEITRILKERQGRPVDTDKVYKALIDEFRVALAHALLLGRGPGIRAYEASEVGVDKAAVTPGDFYDYFRQQRTELDLLVVPVPVSSVLALLKQNPKKEDLEKAFSPEVASAIANLAASTPNKQELEVLFEAHKKKVPEPWSPYPAFKQPRRVQIDWIEIPDSPDPTYLKLAALSNTGLFPAPNPWVPIFAQFDREQRVKDLARSISALYPTPTLLEGDPALAYRTAVVTNETVAFDVLNAGQVPGVVGTAGLGANIGAALNLVVNSQTTPVTVAKMKTDKKQGFVDPKPFIDRDRARRSEAIASLVADGMGKAGTGMPWAWSGMMLIPEGETQWEPRWYWTGLDAPLPPVNPGALEAQIGGRLLNELAMSLFQANLQALEAELFKVFNDPKQLEKQFPELLKNYGFTKYVKSSGRLLDMYAVEKDPSVKPLRDEFRKARRGQDEVAESRFASLFFNSFLPAHFPYLGSQVGLPQFVFWKSQDIPAAEPTSVDDPKYPQTRSLVEEAWRTQKARGVAEMIAADIQKELAARVKSDDLAGKIAEARKQAVAGQTEIDRSTPGLAERKENEAAKKAAHTFFDKAFADITKKYQPLKFDLGAPFPLDQVANRIKELALLPGGGYKAWKAPEEQMPYPPADFVSRMLKTGVGEVGIISDLPTENYYLVATLRKQEPTVEDVLRERRFASFIRGSDPKWGELTAAFRLGEVSSGGIDDPLWKDFAEERFKKSRKELVLRLRQEAGKVDAKGRFVLNEGIRKEETTTTAAPESD